MYSKLWMFIHQRVEETAAVMLGKRGQESNESRKYLELNQQFEWSLKFVRHTILDNSFRCIMIVLLLLLFYIAYFNIVEGPGVFLRWVYMFFLFVHILSGNSGISLFLNCPYVCLCLCVCSCLSCKSMSFPVMDYQPHLLPSDTWHQPPGNLQGCQPDLKVHISTSEATWKMSPDAVNVDTNNGGGRKLDRSDQCLTFE